MSSYKNPALEMLLVEDIIGGGKLEFGIRTEERLGLLNAYNCLICHLAIFLTVKPA
ncbi:hypothetical protein Fmac_001878 [Flemingia macrophylla]|uniref:Uncharacterized protein n=1 Tax=Flemingia macrophylla TaxID=520843 RepID=A0ABD1NIB6_9FABA